MIFSAAGEWPRRAMVGYTVGMPTHGKRERGLGAVIILVMIAALMAATGAGFWYYQDRELAPAAGGSLVAANDAALTAAKAKLAQEASQPGRHAGGLSVVAGPRRPGRVGFRLCRRCGGYGPASSSTRRGSFEADRSIRLPWPGSRICAPKPNPPHPGMPCRDSRPSPRPWRPWPIWPSCRSI